MSSVTAQCKIKLNYRRICRLGYVVIGWKLDWFPCLVSTTLEENQYTCRISINRNSVLEDHYIYPSSKSSDGEY